MNGQIGLDVCQSAPERTFQVLWFCVRDSNVDEADLQLLGRVDSCSLGCTRAYTARATVQSELSARMQV